MKHNFATTKTVLISLLLVLAICCLAVTVALNYSEQVAQANGQVVAAGQPVTSVDELPQDSSSGNNESMPIANAGTAGNFTQFKTYWDDASYDKITLSGTVTLTSNIALTRSMTIDLNNNNLVMGNFTISVNNGGSLTIQDTASNKTSRNVQAFKVGEEARSAIPITGGVIVGGDARVIQVNAGGKVFLQGGTIVGVQIADAVILLSDETSEFTMSNGAISYNRVSSQNSILGIGYGTVTMTGGSISYNTVANSGAVYVSHGSFNMSGGAAITGNQIGKSGTVFVSSADATFNMSGGKITGNTAPLGGGVYVASGTFNMSAGTISGNTATTGNGVYLSGVNSKIALSGTASCDVTLGANVTLTSKFSIGGTVTIDLNNYNLIVGENTISVVDGGSLTIQDTAEKKTARDVQAFKVGDSGRSNISITGGVVVGGDARILAVQDSGQLFLKSGTVAGAQAVDAALYLGAEESKFTMSGGAVLYNRISTNNSIVGIGRGTFTMTGGSISYNTVNSTGVVYVSTGTFNMSGDAAITGNKVGQYGGGVYVGSASATFNMRGGTISGNTAQYGGGVYVASGTFNMSAGTISGNTATALGNGVYLGNANGKIALSGTASCDVTLGANITLDSKFSIGGTVTIDLNNYNFIVGENTITVANGGSLTIQDLAEKKTARKVSAFAVGATERSDIDITGGVVVGGDARIIHVNAGGKCFLKSGTIAGVQAVDATIYTAGEFTMSGGAISYNRSSGNTSGIGIGGGGTFTMTSGSISYNTAVNIGAGVYVNSGTFNMSGDAIITGNQAGDVGGGVIVALAEATFNMSGGTITGNQAKNGGGVGVYKGRFSMSAGTVTDNTATTSGNNVYLYNVDAKIDISGTATCDIKLGADITLDSKFSIGGTVTIDLNNHNLIVGENTITVADGGSLTIQDLAEKKTARKISAFAVGAAERSDINITGGVVVGGDVRILSVQGSGQLFLKSGTIAGVQAVDAAIHLGDDNAKFTMSGGAVLYNRISTNNSIVGIGRGTFTMTGGSISYNTVNSTGVVFVSTGTFNMSGDAEITGNQVGQYGGGVYVSSASATFNMSGGTISGNTAQYGGGVYVNSGTFNMSAGTISGNTATENGGGVYVRASGKFNLSGNAVIKDNKKDNANNNVYLASGATINITAAITSEANSIGITAETDGVFTTGIDVTATTGFFADDSGKCIGVTEEYKLSIAIHSATNWNHTSEQHWQECTNCGVKENEGAHGWSWTAEGETHNATCSADCGVEQKTHGATNPNEWTESTADGHSGNCAAEGCTIKITRDHTYTGTWDQEEEYHSQTCTAPGCEYKKTEGHNLDGYVDAGDGANHMAACTICQKTGVKSAHTPNTSVKPQGDQFSHWYECTLCSGDVKTNHDWTSLPYATDNSGQHWQFCEDCEFKYNETGHTKSEILQKDATCGDSGTRGYFTCLVCKFNFEDDSLTIEIKDIEDWLTKGEGFIPADESAHVWSAWLYDTANDEHYKQCTVCRKESGRAVHNLQLMEGTPASCTENGTHEYYYCRVCRSAFEDKNGSKVIGDQDTLDDWLETGAGKIEAGHSWNEKGICTVCGDYSKWLEDMRGLVEDLEDPEKSEIEKKLDEIDPSKPGYVPPEDPEQTLGEIEQEIQDALEEQHPGLEEDKEDAIRQLEEAAAKKNEEIAGNDQLSDQQIQDLQDQVTKELEKAKRNVELATDSDGVEQALEEGKEAINGVKADVQPDDGHTHSWSQTPSSDDTGHWYECETCHERKGFEKHVISSESNNIVVNGNETHTADCIVCGRSVNESHVSNGSTYQDNHDVSGHWLVCAVCSAQFKKVEHEWSEDDWQVADGYHYQECEVCKEVYKQDHSMTNWTTTGSTEHTRSCEICSKEETTSHVWGETYYDNADGKHYQKCDDCGASSEAVPHNYNGKYYDDNKGNHYQVCADCGYETEHTQHSVSSWTSKGSETHQGQCSECELTVTAEHAWNDSNWTYTSGSATHWHECTDCHAKKDETAHVLTNVKWDNSDSTYHTGDCECGATNVQQEHVLEWQQEVSQHYQKCTVEGCTYATSPAEHSSSVWKDTGDKDKHTGYCPTCGMEQATKSHDWTEKVEGNADGHWDATCQECGAKRNYSAHEWDKIGWTVENGSHYKKCTNDECGYKYREEAHYLTKHTGYAADCTNTGLKDYWECAVCSTYFDDEKGMNKIDLEDWQDKLEGQGGGKLDIVESAHVWDNAWHYDGDGGHYHVCTLNGSHHSEDVQSHNYNGKYYDDGKGNHYQVCADCGYETEHSQHSVSSWTSKGSDIHQGQCSECQLTVTEEHDWETETKSYDDYGHWFKCKSTDCTARKDYQEHNVTDWTNADGNHTGDCDDCDKTGITAEHVWGDWQDDGSSHYRQCKLCNAEDPTGHVAHTVTIASFVDNDGHQGFCTECKLLVKVAHTLNPDFKAEGNHDLSGHWNLCSVCNGKVNKETHEWLGDWTPAEEDHFKTCETCGQEKREAHSVTSWENAHDNANHKGQCECGKEIKQAHVLSELKKEAEGNKYYQECTVDGCDYETEHKDLGDVHVHNWERKSDDNSHWMQCTDPSCNARKEEKPHDESEWKFEGKNHYKYCETCGQKYHNEEHELTKHTGYAADCVNTGLKDYWECAICKTYFDDDQGMNKIDLEEWQDKLEGQGGGKLDVDTSAHEWDSAWHFDGETQGHYHVCTRDGSHHSSDVQPHSFSGSYFDDGNGKHYQKCEYCGALSESVAHNMQRIAEVPATCTDSGSKAYYICTDCAGIYSNANGTNKIPNLNDWLASEGKIPSLGNGSHSYDPETGICSVCGALDPEVKAELEKKLQDAQSQLEDKKRELEEKKSQGSLSPEEEAKLKELEEKLKQLQDALDALENANSSDDMGGIVDDVNGALGDAADATDSTLAQDKLDALDELEKAYEEQQEAVKNGELTPEQQADLLAKLGDAYKEAQKKIKQATSKDDADKAAQDGAKALEDLVENYDPDTVPGGSHTHTWVQKSDENYHWEECTDVTCGARRNVNAHEVSDWTMKDATTHTGECGVCGATVTQAHKLNKDNACELCDFTMSSPSECDHVVTSGTSNGNETHSGVCEICGLTVSVAHVWSEEFVTDEHGHWYECTVCGDRKDYAEHHVTEWTSDGEHTHSGTCEVCGEVITHDHSWLFGFCTECPDKLGNYAGDNEVGIAAVAIVAQLFALIAVAAIVSRRMKR